MSEDTLVADSEVETPNDSPVDQSAESAVSPEPQAEAQPAAPQQQAQQNLWDAFRALPDFRGQDDLAIARRLYESMERERSATQRLQQYQQYIPYAQQYLQHRPEFEQWMASRGQQQPQPQAPAPQAQQPSVQDALQKFWNPPELRESYKQYLVRDESGREVISPEAPLDAKHSLYEYLKYKADFAQKFLSNPIEALGPMVSEIANRQAQQIVQEQFQTVQEEQYVSNLERDNADWLYDAEGQPTRYGLAVQGYIKEAADAGITSPEMRWRFAEMKLENALHNELQGIRQQQQQRTAFEAVLPAQNAQLAPAGAVAQAAPADASAPQAAQPDATTRAQRDIEFLRREASRNPSRATASDDPRAAQAPMTFEQRLTQQAKRAGLL
jgi:hypothetical protein